ncbi:MAG: metal-sulfur cluster assembly factor [Verrucomicrobiota bacterium]
MNAIELDEPLVVETLRQVIDPEIDCNIVDLGLIYGVNIEGSTIRVQMTLTTQGCPMHESIASGVKMALLNVEGVKDAQVQVVWDPPWHPSMMTDYGRARVGLRA